MKPCAVGAANCPLQKPPRKTEPTPSHTPSNRLAPSDPLAQLCGPRGSVPDPQGQIGDPEGPAVRTWSLLTSNATDCAYRPTRPGDPFCWSRGSSPAPQRQNLVQRVPLPQWFFRTPLMPGFS